MSPASDAEHVEYAGRYYLESMHAHSLSSIILKTVHNQAARFVYNNY